MGGLVAKPSAQASIDEGLLADLKRIQASNEKIFNLENRQITSEQINKLSAGNTQYTRQVISLSLASNRLTNLLFVDPTRENSTSSNLSNPPLSTTTRDSIHSLSAASTRHSSSNISTNNSPWSCLENLDLSGNSELYLYDGLEGLCTALKSLRVASNNIFKVPTSIWQLVNLTALDLSRNRLLVIPPAIESLTALHTLKLAHNSLYSLPEEMKACTRLRRLDLSHNKYTELPVNKSKPQPIINNNSLNNSSNNSNSHSNNLSNFPPRQAETKLNAKFSVAVDAGAINQSFAATSTIKYLDPARLSYLQITHLNLANNLLESLSPSIGLLRCLNSLNLGYNKLRSLPGEIALLSELKYLDLRFNQLPSLLGEICSLPRLSKLCLQNNKLSVLPYEIKKLTKITHFFLSSNFLVDLPDTIGEMNNLKILKLCNNKLLTVPDSLFKLPRLRLLDLSFNKLNYISVALCGAKSLQQIRLWGNKIEQLPQPIIYADLRKIVQYLRANEKEKTLIYSQLKHLQPNAGANSANSGGNLPGNRPSSHIFSSNSANPTNLSARSSSKPSGPISLLRRASKKAKSATRANSTQENYTKFSPLGYTGGEEEDNSEFFDAESSNNLSGEEQASDDEFTSVFRPSSGRSSANQAQSFSAINEIYQLQGSKVTAATAASLGLKQNSNYIQPYHNNRRKSGQQGALLGNSRPPTHPNSAGNSRPISRVNSNSNKANFSDQTFPSTANNNAGSSNNNLVTAINLNSDFNVDNLAAPGSSGGYRRSSTYSHNSLAAGRPPQRVASLCSANSRGHSKSQSPQPTDCLNDLVRREQQGKGGAQDSDGAGSSNVVFSSPESEQIELWQSVEKQPQIIKPKATRQTQIRYN
jgi:Leucine-rich repeat (LRR) protein